jgi:hypothetical protein
MALITSAASGNFNAGATWTGGVVPTTGDEARASTGHTVTINVNTTCDEISNAGTGKFVLNDGITLTANVTNKSATTATNCLEFSTNSPATAAIVGDCTGGSGVSCRAVNILGSGTLTITGNCTGGVGNTSQCLINASTGRVNITGNLLGGSGPGTPFAVQNSSTGTINVTGNATGGTSAGGQAAFQSSTGILSIIGTVTASLTAAGVAGANVQQVTILSGPFITETTRGVNPVYCAAWRWNASPSNSTYLEVMTNDLLAKRNLVTEDNVTGMPDEADVKDGIVYGPTSALTGTFEQTLSPSVSDIATAVWGAATRTITGGTVDTLVNAPASVTPSDIWSHSSRTITGGTVDTLTNAPTVPSAASIRAEIDSNSTQLAAIKAKTDLLPASPAATGDIPTADITAIKGKTDLLNTDRLGQCSTVATTGAQLAAALS